MKRGFTVIELLVASLILGVLVTILTMIFNQSSIAWRIGSASVAKLAKSRTKIAVVAEQADDVIIWGDTVYRVTGLWDDQKGGTGDLRRENVGRSQDSLKKYLISELQVLNEDTKQTQFSQPKVGDDDDSGDGNTYIVNVMSAGPDKTWETYDDIWSWPEWK